MKSETKIILEPCMIEAIENLDKYITLITGKKPAQKELADALSKYFVLKEIREFIEMTRKEKADN
ncbi:MAG: hypothetical protein L3J69_15715 [Desulfobacula sp.]|nr:hypothetical protein [Desulfobacula sp.]